MPAETGFLLLPAVVLGFIALVFVVIAAVIVSRVVRLARGGPDAERLRQQLLLQQHSRSLLHDGHNAAIDANRAFTDLQQQQIAIDLASPPTSSNPPT